MKLPIYRHRQQQKNRWIKSISKSKAEITLINEGAGRADIKGAVSIKNVSLPHALYSSKKGEIFPEKTP